MGNKIGSRVFTFFTKRESKQNAGIHKLTFKFTKIWDTFELSETYHAMEFSNPLSSNTNVFRSSIEMLVINN